MEVVSGILTSAATLFADMAPYVLLGLLCAGFLHMILPEGLIRRHAAAGKKSGPFAMSLLGVPMPLCSCGVLPFAAGLRREGAGRGATLAFLTSTPQTGVDSILVAYSFFGLPFALLKVAVAFISGVVGGYFTGLLPEEREEARQGGNGPDGDTEAAKPSRGVVGWFAEMLRYAFTNILRDIALWLLIGVVIAGVVAHFFPPHSGTLGVFKNPFLYYPVILLISIPLYVCSTASVPIAYSLVAAGVPPGAALVFLMAGPATNAATVAVVSKTLGKRSAVLYLLNIVVFSALGGALFDSFLTTSTATAGGHHAHDMTPGFFSIASAVLLGVLSVYHIAAKIWKRFRSPESAAQEDGSDTVMKVKGMSCEHCVATISKAVEAVDGVQQVTVDLKQERLAFEGAADSGAVRKAIEAAGFEVV